MTKIWNQAKLAQNRRPRRKVVYAPVGNALIGDSRACDSCGYLHCSCVERKSLPTSINVKSCDITLASPEQPRFVAGLAQWLV